MDELIILLIRGIGRLLQGPKPPVRQPGQQAPLAIPVERSSIPGSPAGSQTRPLNQAGGPQYHGGAPKKAKAPQRRGGQKRPATRQPVPAQSPDTRAIVTSLQSIQSPLLQRPVARTTTGANAVSLHRWLTPQTLRSQFILTEILRPPLALRDENR